MTCGELKDSQTFLDITDPESHLTEYTIFTSILQGLRIMANF